MNFPWLGIIVCGSLDFLYVFTYSASCGDHHYLELEKKEFFLLRTRGFVYSTSMLYFIIVAAGTGMFVCRKISTSRFLFPFFLDMIFFKTKDNIACSDLGGMGSTMV